MNVDQMEKPQTPATKTSSRRKIWLRVGIGVVLILGTAEGAYWWHRTTVERRQAEAESRAEQIIAQGAGTKDYKKAREQVIAGHFDLATIKRAFTAEIRRQTMIRVDGYFDQKTDPERTAYLDRVINESLAYQKFAATSRPASSSRGPSPGTGSFVTWMGEQPAVSRARMAEFGAAYNARLTQCGMPRVYAPLQ